MHGGLRLQRRTDGSKKDQVFYRDVIKEGWLGKLPPLGNTFSGWKRRWFRLVVVLSTLPDSGPVQLEYYSKVVFFLVFFFSLHVCLFRFVSYVCPKPRQRLVASPKE
jgi:hypothetical protein